MASTIPLCDTPVTHLIADHFSGSSNRSGEIRRGA